MSVTYIVPWRDIVGEADMEEFCNISRAIYWAYQSPEVSNPEERVYKSLKNDAARDRYVRYRGIMRQCGYEKQQDEDVNRWRGWLDIYLDGDDVCFKTNAPLDRVYISMADFLEYRDLCRMEDKDAEGNSRDVTAMIKKLALKMASKYGRKAA